MTAPAVNPILASLQREWVYSHPRRPRPAVSQGEPMPPVASAQAAIEHAAIRLAEFASSRLVVALADQGLGTHLTRDDVDHIVALVRAIEEPRRHAEMMKLPEEPRRRQPVQLPEGNANGTGPQQPTFIPDPAHADGES